MEKAFYPSFLKLLQNPLSFTYTFKGFPNVSRDTSPDGRFRIINAGYATGGTSSYTGSNYVQYLYHDSVRVKLVGADFSEIKSTGFEIFQLKSTMADTMLYLLIGEAKGNTSSGIYEAVVFGLGPDGLIEHYHAFPNRTNYMFLDCYYGEDKFSFNRKNQILTVDLTDCDQAQSELMDQLHLYHRKDNKEDITDYGDWVTKLKFNGKQFVVVRHPIHNHDDN